MATRIFYHTQGIRGFHYKKAERKGDTEYYHLSGTASSLPCPCCGSRETKLSSTADTRCVRGLPVGLKKRFS